MTAYALGCDYSTKAVHLALVSRDEVIEREHTAISFDDLAGTILELDGLLNQLIWKHRVAALWLETPWFAGGKFVDGTFVAGRSNNNTLKLHRVAHWIEALAIRTGISVHYVSPAEWRSQILGVGGRAKTAELKRASLRYAQMVYGVETKDDNLADAIAIAAYGLAQARREGT